MAKNQNSSPAMKNVTKLSNMNSSSSSVMVSSGIGRKWTSQPTSWVLWEVAHMLSCVKLPNDERCVRATVNLIIHLFIPTCGCSLDDLREDVLRNILPVLHGDLSLLDQLSSGRTQQATGIPHFVNKRSVPGVVLEEQTPVTAPSIAEELVLYSRTYKFGYN